MFGYVAASLSELTDAQRQRYHAVYCGICRCMGRQASQPSRIALRYDSTFLALLLMSLYEPEEICEDGRCLAHPLSKRPWVDSDCIRYAADINIALAYCKAMDDWHDEKKLSAKVMSAALGSHLPQLQARHPRQWEAMQCCIRRLSQLERENSGDLDACAGCFGQLMAQLLVYREDYWANTLRTLGMALGRFIYLADAACDYHRDCKAGRYNPYAASGCCDEAIWREHLVLAMGRASEAFEMLPLVQDKEILDNIIYSGVWTRLTFGKKEDRRGGSV